MTLRGFPSREAIREHQLTELRRLLGPVAADNPFYRPILKQAGLDSSIESLDQFLSQMPFTTKEAIVADHDRHPPYGTNLTYPLEHYCRFYQTSGTSGRPLRWLDTLESWQWLLDNWKQVFAAAGVCRSDVLYFAFSFGPFLGFWTAYEAAGQLGCLCIPGGGASSLARLEAMRDNHATVLLCTPTYAMRLAEVAAAEKLDLHAFDVQTIIVAGEPGGSVLAVCHAMQRRWPKARLFDHHGMTEVGPVSYECPQRPGSLVVIESSYLAEIIDPKTLHPVQPGALGELVLTTLGRLGSPVIRYRTGDLVREETRLAAKCGRHELILKGGILGRVDDMVVVRSVNIYPSAIDAVLRSISEIAEYRVEISQQESMTELEILVEPVPDCCDHQSLSNRIETKLRSAFHLRIPVSLCAVGSLPRFEMKSRRWVRK